MPSDVKQRASELLASYGGSLGCYSKLHMGSSLVRKHVAEFIEQRDGFPCNPEEIVLAGGASNVIRDIIEILSGSSGPKTVAFMTPCPQYPLYSALLTKNGMTHVGYLLDEDNHWALDIQELDRVFERNKDVFDIKVLVVINPGNPTGQVLTKENMQEVVKFAHRRHLLILADEVYQENVYGVKFHSFKKVLCEMGEPYSKMELMSVNSCSKGYIGECGLSGYGEMLNWDPEVIATYKNMICSNLTSLYSQTVMDCYVNPPKEGSPSYPLWLEERNDHLNTLKEKAQLVTKAFNSIEGIGTQQVQGAMYAFPRLQLPPKAIELARAKGLEPDYFYAWELLEETGVAVTPGSGFGQREGTYHFRTTILPPPDKFKELLERFTRFHKNFMKKYS